jgi:GT2 family glycosyltransferase
MKEAAIVILNYNGEAMLRKYLPQVTSNSFYDIIVVDNGSIDTSVTFLKHNFPNIRLVLLQENHGYSKGYNLGLEKLKGEYSHYLLLNSDVEVTANWDKALVAYMSDKPGVAVCQPKVLSLVLNGYFDYAGAAGGFFGSFGISLLQGKNAPFIGKGYGTIQ